jgi:hypothetical protein
VLLGVLSLPGLAVAEKDVAVLGVGNVATQSSGKFDCGMTARQGNKASAGAASYLEMWRANNGIVVGGSYTRTDSELRLPSGPVRFDSWILQRYKLDALFEHRFLRGRRVNPYVGAGGFMTVLWGGNAPAHSGVNCSGWDVLGGWSVPAGATIHLSRQLQLRTGVLVGAGKASTYGDQTYTSSRTFMFEPELGLVFGLKGHHP